MFFLITLSSPGQKLPFREYTTDDGLPQSQSLDMMQDSRGYLWVQTRNGLAQFNGYTFVSYLRKDGLPSNIVTKVFEDDAGILWAITQNGAARFNGVNFHGYFLPDSLRIRQIAFSCTAERPGAFYLTGYDTITDQKIILFDNGTYRDITAAYPVLDKKYLRAILYHPGDSSLYLTDNDRRLFVLRKGELTPVSNGPVTGGMIKDDRAVFIYGDSTRIPEIITSGWQYGNILFCVTDREGSAWVATESKIFRLISGAFLEYDESDGMPVSPWAIAADPAGGLWIGSVNGELSYFDGKKFISRNDYSNLCGEGIAFYRGSTTLSNGEVWLSTNRGVLISDKGKFRKLRLIPDRRQVCIIYEDPVDKSVFLGTGEGLYHIIGNKVKAYPQISDSKMGVCEGIVRDDNGNYWIASHYGIILFDGKNFIPLHSEDAPAEMAWGIIKDHKGKIWVTGSDGLFTCDPDSKIFRPALPEGLNLPANVIRDLGNGRLIVGRMLDICIIDLDKYYAGNPDYYSIIGRSRGYNGNDCQDNGIVKDAAGNWWLLASDKLIRFDPEKLRKNAYPPAIHITAVEVPGDSLAWVTVLDSTLFYNTAGNITVKGKRNGLRISYTGISTTNPDDVTYQYRLSGIDDKWSARTGERFVIFNNLPPGAYTFEVNAFNADGVRSSEPDILNVTVQPVFMQKAYVRVTLALLALAFVVLLSLQIRRRVIDRRIEAARQQAESYRLQLNSVIRQLDPHFTFNALTSVGSLIMKGEKEKTYTYFIKLSNLLRSVLSDSALLLKPLKEEAEFVTRYCELQKLRFGDRFDYSITIDREVDPNTPVPKMIIQAFAENAVKHGFENKKDRGILQISITRNEKGIEVIVRDNGIGREAASKLQTDGHGMGLKNVDSMITMMNRVNTEKITVDLTDLYDNDQPAGTEVRVFLPFNYTFDLPRNPDQQYLK